MPSSRRACGKLKFCVIVLSAELIPCNCVCVGGRGSQTKARCVKKENSSLLYSSLRILSSDMILGMEDLVKALSAGGGN